MLSMEVDIIHDLTQFDIVHRKLSYWVLRETQDDITSIV